MGLVLCSFEAIVHPSRFQIFSQLGVVPIVTRVLWYHSESITRIAPSVRALQKSSPFSLTVIVQSFSSTLLKIWINTLLAFAFFVASEARQCLCFVFIYTRNRIGTLRCPPMQYDGMLSSTSALPFSFFDAFRGSHILFLQLESTFLTNG